MANFSSPFPLLDHAMDSVSHQFPEINHPSLLFDNPNLPADFNSLLPDHFFNHQNFPATVYYQNSLLPVVSNSATNPSAPQAQTENKKRKALDLSESSHSLNSSPQVSDCRKGKNVSRKGKKPKGENEEEEKPKEVVHVRARRGQATDSHSLAERVRRGKINERLKCLQDIVPGCYKTMGMAVMLDEIINYVQSLQNQVEFLSMKLTAASTYYDFNSETDAIEAIQRAKAQEMERGSMSTQYHHPSWSL